MSLADVVRNLGRPNIAVAGDLMLDRYVFGSVERISPEAPIGVLKVAEEEVRLGGAGSVARDLAVLGAHVSLCGFLGTGTSGDEFLRLTAEAGIDTTRVRRVPGRKTSLKTRLIARRGAGGQQVLRVDREDDSPYAEEEYGALGAAVLTAIDGADLLVLSDYAKGALSPDLARASIAAARGKGIRALVDPKVPGLQDGRYRGASIVTPNRSEAAACVGFPIDGPGSARRAARLIAEGMDLEAAAITLDRDGICVFTRGGHEKHYPIVPREVYDVTGAGDMVIAAMAVVLASGGDLELAVRLANVAAGLEVMKLGVVPVSRGELLEALHEAEAPRRGKGRTPAELREVLAACRGRGQKIVFTNGCFDLLHAGHVRLLRFSRDAGDVLVVGLNSDASVRRLKGEGRPVTPEAERVEVLSSLASVDHVLVFDEDTPLKAIEVVEPDVLIKGEDWRDKGVVGREFVEARGGRVLLFPLTPGLSSTGLLRRLGKIGSDPIFQGRAASEAGGLPRPRRDADRRRGIPVAAGPGAPAARRGGGRRAAQGGGLPPRRHLEPVRDRARVPHGRGLCARARRDRGGPGGDLRRRVPLPAPPGFRNARAANQPPVCSSPPRGNCRSTSPVPSSSGIGSRTLWPAWPRAAGSCSSAPVPRRPEPPGPTTSPARRT